MREDNTRLKLLLLGGLSLLTGLPFLAAGFSAKLLTGRLNRGLPAAVVIVVVSWYLTGFQGAALTAVCAAVTAVAARSGYTILKTLYASSGFTLLTAALLSLGFPGFMNLGETELEPLRSIYVSAGLDSGTVDHLFSLITYYSPGIGAVQIVLGSILSVLFFQSLNHRSTSSVIKGKARFSMHWAVAWIPIVSLTVLVTAGMSHVSPLALRMAKNLLVFSALPYGIEGLQVAVRWVKSLPGMALMLILSAVFAPPVVLGSLVLLGILDTWFDYRKKIDLRIERMKNEGSSDQNS
jgi:hypothetical protein